MRKNRSGLQKRIDQLAKQVVPSEEDYRQRLKTMSDIELQWRIVQHYEEVLGSLAAFESLEGMESRLSEVADPSAETLRLHLRSALGEHMASRWWFRDHRAHGPFRVVEGAPGDDSFFGNRLLVECSSCAVRDPRLSYQETREFVFWKLVPDWAKAVVLAGHVK